MLHEFCIKEGRKKTVLRISNARPLLFCGVICFEAFNAHLAWMADFCVFLTVRSRISGFCVQTRDAAIKIFARDDQ